MQNSNQPSFKKCENETECKNVAVDRLKDAVALLKDGQYIGALYMAGYVIEIGIKAEFHRLAKKEVPSKFKNKENENDFNKILEILKYVAGRKISVSKNSLEDCFKSDPPTVWQLLNCLRRDHLSSPSHAFSCIVENRYKPEQERGPSHNIESFLEELQKWKRQLDDPPSFKSSDYKISIWSTDLRYSIDTTATSKKTSTVVNTTAVTAVNAVTTSFLFLKDVLGIEDKPILEIRGKLLEIMEKLKLPSLVAKLTINKDVHKPDPEYIMSNEVKNEVNKNA